MPQIFGCNFLQQNGERLIDRLVMHLGKIDMCDFLVGVKSAIKWICHTLQASECKHYTNFFGEESVFYELFSGPFAVMDEHFNTVLPNSFDAIGILLMIRITNQHQCVRGLRIYVDYRDGQLDLNMERLKMAIDGLLIKLAKMFTKPQLQTVFLIIYITSKSQMNSK